MQSQNTSITGSKIAVLVSGERAPLTHNFYTFIA